MTTETKVEAVAADELAEHLGFNIKLIPSVQREAIESEVAVVLKVADRFHQSALDALRGEVADRDAVIECKNIDIRERDRSLHEWAERAKAAERRAASIFDDDDTIEAIAYWLCLHDGCEDPHYLIWSGNPPEPQGEVWHTYLPQARELVDSIKERRALTKESQ